MLICGNDDACSVLKWRHAMVDRVPGDEVRDLVALREYRNASQCSTRIPRSSEKVILKKKLDLHGFEMVFLMIPAESFAGAYSWLV